MRALLWPLFDSSALAQPATVVEGTTFEDAVLAFVMSAGEVSSSHWGRRGRQVISLLWPLFAWLAWAQQATVVVGTTGEGSTLATFRLVVVGPASHHGGLHDILGR